MVKVAIFHALYLGDFLCTVPALRALRNHYPTAEITYIGLPVIKDLVLRYTNFVDRFVAFPGFPLLTEEPIDTSTFQHFLEEIRKEKFDLIFQMQGNGRIINNLLKSFNAKRIVGFRQSAGTASRELKDFLTYPANLHEIHRHLSLLNHIGIPSQGDHLFFPLTDKDQEDFEKAALSLSPPYVCIHPGSKAAWRRWPVKNFSKIGNYLSDRGFQIVITGTKAEQQLGIELTMHMQKPPLISSGKLSLGGTAILLKGAAMVFTNCTGISHLAAALQKPSMVISMDGEPHRWGPLNKSLHRTYDWNANPDEERVFKEFEEFLALNSI